MIVLRGALISVWLLLVFGLPYRAEPQETHPHLVAGGVSAESPPRPAMFPAPPSAASWIWAPPASEAKNNQAVVCFRKSVSLAAIPKNAVAWISADRHYRLYVNGKLAARGPADPGEDYPGGKSRGQTGITYCDFRDLTSLFHKGVNTLAVEVFTTRLSDWYGSSGHAGLFFASKITMPDRAVLAVQTDETWRAMPGDYLQTGSEGLRYVSAKEPVGWQLPGFDDSGWSGCVRAGAYWPNLRTSQLPAPMEMAYPALKTVRISPSLASQIAEHPFRDGHSLLLSSNGSFTLQYDRILSAYVRVKVKGGAGAQLHLALNETNSPGGRREVTLLLSGGEQVFETPFYSSFTFLNVTASHVTTLLEIEEITAEFVSYPVVYRGTFACSDAQFNQLWAASRWATQICMQDHYLDSPDHQEPICDPGDYMIESLLSAYAFGESGLTRQDLRKFGALLAANNYINFHTSYALLWLQMLVDYYDQTGDATLVKELAPQVFGLLDRFATWRGKNGLLSEAPDYMFMDWVSIAGIACHHPPAVIGQGYMTAFYYRGLADGLRVAQMVGDTKRAQSYADLRPQIAAAFNRELWVNSRGLYRDGKPFQTTVKPGPWLPADTDIETFSPHVNLLAVLYDLAPKERQTAILTQVMAQKPLNCQPYFYHFVFEALQHGGLFETYMIESMQRWKINPDTQTFSEMWGTGDWSHAWGGTPLYQLSSKVLGVTPSLPGYKRIAIAPLCGLNWAKGRVPTPRGDVDVSWQHTPKGLTLDITIPRGTEADVTLPLMLFPNAASTFNKQKIANRPGSSQTAGIVHIKSGRSHFFLKSNHR